MHHADIQHCDLKPDNVFFGRDGDVRIADFGISNKSTKRIHGAFVSGDKGGSNAVNIIGTPGYITPTLLRLRDGTYADRQSASFRSLHGNITFDYRSHDGFSFIIIALQVLTGRLPYDDNARV